MSSGSAEAPPAAPLDLVNVGKVGRPHALAGAFFVSDRTEPIPKSYTDLFVGRDAAGAVVCKILMSTMQAGRPLLKVSLATDRTGAEALTGQAIFAERRRVKARNQSKDDLVWSDLEGLAVVDSAGLTLGVITDLYNSGSSDIIVVKGASGTIDLPLIEAYFDPAAVEVDKLVRLKVTADTFDGLWQAAPRG